MKYDKTKVVTGKVYPVKDKHLVFANGCLRITTEGITSFQDIAPYNSTTGSDIPHAYEGHGGVDVRAGVGTPVYAEKDLTITTGNDDWGNKVICNGFRMRHMDKLPTKTSFKKGEVVFYTGCESTNAPHLHIGMENGGDAFATFVEGKTSASSSTPPAAKTFKAVREGKSTDNGTFYFDEKYYADFKDGTQASSAVDTKGNTWEATTTWTKVYAPEGSSSSTTKTVKGYSFNECSGNNGVSYFDIEEYGSTQDDLCFNIENLKKLSDGSYDLIKAQHDYDVHTRFRKIKTTFYK